jgi:hypothetical protein
MVGHGGAWIHPHSLGNEVLIESLLAGTLVKPQLVLFIRQWVFIATPFVAETF